MFKMHRYSFSKPITFAIHIPMLALNIFIVGALIWDILPSTQSKIFTNYSANVPTVVSVVTNSIATIYGLTLIFLALFNIVIPAFHRIIINCAILFPCYMISIVILLLRNDWFGLKQIVTGQARVTSVAGASAFTAVASGPSHVQHNIVHATDHLRKISRQLAGFSAFAAIPGSKKPREAANLASFAAKVPRDLAGFAAFESIRVNGPKKPRDLAGFAAFESIRVNGPKKPRGLAGFASFVLADKVPVGPRAEPESGGSAPELTCTDPSWTTEMCAQRWKTVTVIQTVAFIFVWLCFLLAVIEVVLAVMIYQRRRDARMTGKNPDNEDDDSESVQGLTVTEVRERWETAIKRA